MSQHSFLCRNNLLVILLNFCRDNSCLCRDNIYLNLGEGRPTGTSTSDHFIMHGPRHCVIGADKDSSMIRVGKDSGHGT